MYASFAFFVIACIAIYSCTHVSGTYISTHGSMAGSSMKDNCMDCHKTGATYGGFIVGGSIYQMDSTTRYPNGTVYLFSQPQDSIGNGIDSVVARIEVDGVGNFYTTHPINLSQGVFPAVVSSIGDTAFMQTITTNGACNSCHGTSIQAKVVVK